jgi:hypothetical protein
MEHLSPHRSCFGEPGNGPLKGGICEKDEILFNILNSELHPICQLLTLLGDHHTLDVSKIIVIQ